MSCLINPFGPNKTMSGSWLCISRYKGSNKNYIPLPSVINCWLRFSSLSSSSWFLLSSRITIIPIRQWTNLHLLMPNARRPMKPANGNKNKLMHSAELQIKQRHHYLSATFAYWTSPGCPEGRIRFYFIFVRTTSWPITDENDTIMMVSFLFTSHTKPTCCRRKPETQIHDCQQFIFYSWVFFL